MWGKQVHFSKVVGKDTLSVEIKRLINVSQKHTNFHSSMTVEELVGIIDFDETFNLHGQGVISHHLTNVYLFAPHFLKLFLFLCNFNKFLNEFCFCLIYFEMKYPLISLYFPGHTTIQQLDLEIQANRKVLHLEVDKGETKFIEKPIEVAKENK